MLLFRRQKNLICRNTWHYFFSPNSLKKRESSNLETRAFLYSLCVLGLQGANELRERFGGVWGERETERRIDLFPLFLVSPVEKRNKNDEMVLLPPHAIRSFGGFYRLHLSSTVFPAGSFSLSLSPFFGMEKSYFFRLAVACTDPYVA